jgi:hypothetical protein
LWGGGGKKEKKKEKEKGKESLHHRGMRHPLSRFIVYSLARATAIDGALISEITFA